jgi:hypothetical protein
MPGKIKYPTPRDSKAQDDVQSPEWMAILRNRLAIEITPHVAT